jgi:phosphatidylglycerol---prolipoprotein diacylglyceryl transferase
LHQTLFYIPLVIAGIPVFGFGLLLAIWTLACLAFLAWLARKQGFTADIWTYVPLLALVGAAIWWLLPVLCNDRGLPIRGYGMMMLLGVLAGTGMTLWRGRRLGFNADTILSLAFWLFVPGLIGARAFYVIEYWSSQYWPYYQQAGLPALLGAVLNVAQGGLVVYGGFLGLVAGLLSFMWKYRLSLLAICDLIAPGMMTGLFLGRLGCLLNGCCYGDLCAVDSLAVRFPWGSPVQVRQAERGQIYLHGLKIVGDPDDPPVVTEIEPGSEAELHDLAVGHRIAEINGVGIERVSDAQAALLGAQRLHVEIDRQNGRTFLWSLDAPPAPGDPIYRAELGKLWIDGMAVAGSDNDSPVVAEVQRGSWAALSGLQAGDRIISLNGRPARTYDELQTLLAEQHSEPWILIKTAGARTAVQWAMERSLPESLPVYPTQLYDSINALLLCLLLLAFEPFTRRRGALFALLMSVYPVTRFFIERIRTDEAKAYYAGMTISQTISLGILLCAAGLWFYVLRQPVEGTGIGDWEQDSGSRG